MNYEKEIKTIKKLFIISLMLIVMIVGMIISNFLFPNYDGAVPTEYEMVQQERFIEINNLAKYHGICIHKYDTENPYMFVNGKKINLIKV